MKHLLFLAMFFLATVILFSGVAKAGTIQGRITYTDKTYNATGFTGTRYLPVPFARIQLYKKTGDGIDDVSFLRSSNLNTDGYFSFSYTSANEQFQIRLYSDCKDGSPNLVRVFDSSSNKYTIIFNGAGLVTDSSGDWSGSSGSLSTPATLCVSEDNSGAFNIMFCIARAAEEVFRLEGSYPNRASVRWSPGSTRGTYVESISEEMFLLGDTTRDTDEFDDDVILHEYGHIISYNYSQEDSPGGYHYGEVTDLRLAWTEAWSGYFSAWMHTLIETRIYGTPTINSRYVDTKTSGATSWDIEPPSAYGFPGLHTNDEIAIQSGLWDIFDGANESWDTEFTFTGSTTGEIAVWETYRSFTSLSSSNQITVEDFWKQWFALGYGNESVMLAIFTEHLKFSFVKDVFEENDTHNKAQLIVSDGTKYSNTFYPDGDTDWFSLSVTHDTEYTVATTSLINGADTVVTVYSNTLSKIYGTNDNRTPSTRESLVTFSSPFDQIVKIKVTHTSTHTYSSQGGYKISAVVGGAVEPPPSSGSSGGGGGCFIATSAFASYTSAQVTLLCDFRDTKLSASTMGNAFISYYYSTSPAIAKSFSSPMQAVLRKLLSTE